MNTEKISAKSDVIKQRMRREYIELLHQELDDLFNNDEKASLLDKLIPVLREELESAKEKSYRMTILQHLIHALKHKIDITFDADDRKKLYEELRKLLITEI